MSITLVNSVVIPGNGSSGGTSSAINTTGANLIVVGVANYSGLVTLTDNKGNTYSKTSTPSAGTTTAYVFYLYTPTVGTGHTFSLSSSGQYPSGVVMAFSVPVGLSGYVIDQYSNTGSSSGTTAQPGSITPAQGNELLVSVISNNYTSSFSVASPFTVVNQVDFASGVNYGVAVAYQIQTTATAENPNWTVSNAGTNATTVIALAPLYYGALGSGDPSGIYAGGTTGAWYASSAEPPYMGVDQWYFPGQTINGPLGVGFNSAYGSGARQLAVAPAAQASYISAPGLTGPIKDNVYFPIDASAGIWFLLIPWMNPKIFPFFGGGGPTVKIGTG